MLYLFDLRLRGKTLHSEKCELPDSEAVIEHAVRIALTAGVPDSRVWVSDTSGIVLIMGMRAAETLLHTRQPARAARHSNDNVSSFAEAE